MAALVVACLSLGASGAQATGFTDLGQDLRASDEARFTLHGLFRTRFELLHNLDLDRGPTPSGDLFFPVPLSDPQGQNLTHADMRARLDLAAFAPGGSVAVKLRLDALDNLSLGSTPDGAPSVSVGQTSVNAPLVVRRAYAEVLTPIGLLSAGRMGATWGLGMLTNGGDCADCDHGDAADRVAFVTPMLGHIWAVAYDFSSSGPFTQRRSSSRTIDVDPRDDVRTFTFAFLRYRGDRARRRRTGAQKLTFDYGVWLSHRRQDRDVPSSYLPVATPVGLDASQSVSRGLRATGVDLWLRLDAPSARIELEAAYLEGRIDQPSLVPGARYRDPIRSRQWGGVLESRFGADEAPVTFGLDLGVASGDSAPGFGAFPKAGAGPTQPGDLDGPQAAPRHDDRVDNLRFHPDYRIDRILFREIIGTVTDAAYVRPHLEWRVASLGDGQLRASLAGVASMAMQASSTPSGSRGLGVELDPTLSYDSGDGFLAQLEYAALFPLAGLDNPTLGLDARPAQLLRLRLGFAY